MAKDSICCIPAFPCLLENYSRFGSNAVVQIVAENGHYITFNSAFFEDVLF